MKPTVLIPAILVPLLAIAGVWTGLLPRAEAGISDEPGIDEPVGGNPDGEPVAEPTPIPIDPTDPDLVVDTEPSPIVAPGYLTARENGIALIQTSRVDSPLHHGWVDITLDLVLTSFANDSAFTPSVTINEEQTKACFATTQERNDCLSVQWGSHEQFVAFLKPVGPANDQWAPGKAQVWAVTFEVPANALNASIVFGPHRVSLALGGQIVRDRSGHVTSTSLRPAPTPDAPAGTDGYYVAGEHGIAVTEVQRVQHVTQPSWAKVAVDLDVMRFKLDDTLDTPIETNTSVRAACFAASMTEDDCVYIRWGYRDAYDAILTSVHNDAVRHWPRAKGWPHELTFIVPSNVDKATLVFGNNEVPLDLLGEKGPSPAWNYLDHYKPLTGLTLHDIGGHSVDLIAVDRDPITSDVVLHFEAANRSENRDFHPRIVFEGARVSAGGQVFDGVDVPPDGWKPPTITVQGGPLAPGQREELTMVLPRIGGNGFNPLPYSDDPPDAMLVRLAADNNTSGAPLAEDVRRFEPYYISFERKPGDADATYFYPDMAVTAIELSETPATAGEPTTVSFTVSNLGPRNALATTLNFLIDGTLFRDLPVPAIVAHGEATVQTTWTATLAPAEFTVVIDPADVVPEAIVSNNSVSTAFPGGVLPDLVITGMRLIPPSEAEGVRVEVTVLNQGLGRARAFQVNGSIPGGSAFFLSFPALPAGATAARDYPWRAQMGTTPIPLVIDGPQAVPESDETNNSAPALLPDLTSTNGVAVVVTASGEGYIHATVTNSGFIASPIVTAKMLVNGVDIMGTVDLGPLAPGQSITLRSSTVPIDGRNLFQLVMDPDQIIPESNETNNTLSFSYVTGPLPELSIRKMTLTPEVFVKDDELQLTFYVQNTGGLVSTPTVVEVWDADANVLIATVDLPKIEPGEERRITHKWLAGESLTNVTLIIDPDELVDEEDETNNTAAIDL